MYSLLWCRGDPIQDTIPIMASKAKKSAKSPSSKQQGQAIQKVAAPIAQGTVIKIERPKISNLKGGDVIVRHREYVSDYAGSVAFASNQIALNPGLPGSFPWLSAVARNYESYKFEVLKLCYETEAPTTTTGSVMLTVDWDASDPAPTNKTQAMAYERAVRTPTWQRVVFSANQEELSKRKTYYVRSGSLTANQDIKLYDAGNLFLCTFGQANTATVGELFIEYTVRLMTPQLGDPSVGQSLWGKFSGTANTNLVSTVVGNLPATASTTGTTTSVTTFVFTQPWQGMMSLVQTGTGLTSFTPGGTATASEEAELINGAASVAMALYSITAQLGQTFTLTVANTTIVTSTMWFGQGDF